MLVPSRTRSGGKHRLGAVANSSSPPSRSVHYRHDIDPLVAPFPSITGAFHAKACGWQEVNLPVEGGEFERFLNDHSTTIIRPSYKCDKPRPGQRFLRPFRLIIESINDTLKDQLDLERHGGRAIGGVTSRVQQRLPTLTTAIWHNDITRQPGPARSLLAYDH